MASKDHIPNIPDTPAELLAATAKCPACEVAAGRPVTLDLEDSLVTIIPPDPTAPDDDFVSLHITPHVCDCCREHGAESSPVHLLLDRGEAKALAATILAAWEGC